MGERYPISTGTGAIVVATLVFGGILFLLSWGNRLAVRKLRIWTDPNRAGEALRTVNKITSGRLPDTLETSIRLTRLGLATVPGAQPGEAQETASFRIQMGGSPSARSAKS